MLGQQDVGHRVVVRRIVGIRGDRPLFSDALGELVDLTETYLTVNTAKGPLRVPLAEVHRAKRVPPPPPKRAPRAPGAPRPTAAAALALELAANDAWPAPIQERLGDWLLRAADGWTGRANSALPVGEPDRPLAAAIDAVQQWYGDRGQPAMITLPSPLPLAGRLGQALDARGWTARPPVLVQTAPLTAVRNATRYRADLPPVELAEAPSKEWLTIAAARKGALPDVARHVLTAVDQIRFAYLYDTVEPGGRQLLGIARGTVTGEGRWLGLTLLEVLPQARGRGLAPQLIRALVEWAAGLGATDFFLQVETANSAVALYERLGFTTHHTYQVRVAPETATAAAG
ncbi:MAG TPA: GNAT family N-acetyltransferase [Micromonosporaceae bacterium]|nr:GNAT family N-acetyltransferase [Micromonosporaceae bacterium]